MLGFATKRQGSQDALESRQATEASTASNSRPLVGVGCVLSNATQLADGSWATSSAGAARAQGRDAAAAEAGGRLVAGAGNEVVASGVVYVSSEGGPGATTTLATAQLQGRSGRSDVQTEVTTGGSAGAGARAGAGASLLTRQMPAGQEVIDAAVQGEARVSAEPGHPLARDLARRRAMSRRGSWGGDEAHG